VERKRAGNARGGGGVNDSNTRRREQHTKTRKIEEDGRDRREGGWHSTQKMEGGSAPSDIGTGEARGSDERATGRQRRGRMEGRRQVRREGRGAKGTKIETGRTRGKCVFGGEGSERTPSSCLTRVQSGQLLSWSGGWSSSW
jgi:hypothetical protein